MAKDSPRIVTANRLKDGVVVFLTGAGTWSEHTADAAVSRTAEEEQALVAQGAAAVKACEVIDVNAIEVNGTQPVRLRERIRQAGPTVRADLARAI